MSRRYPLAVNAATALALSESAGELNRQSLQALVNAVRRDWVMLVLITQRTHQAQALSSFLCLLSLYRAGRTIEAAEHIRQALAPLLDDPALAVLDDLVRANLAVQLERQTLASQEVLAWFYQKGERA